MKLLNVISWICVFLICYKIFFEVQQARQGIGGEAFLLFVPAIIALLNLKSKRKDD